MNNTLSRIFDTEEYADFCAEVHSTLLIEAKSLTEYELLELLKKRSRFSFIKCIFDNNLSLFHSHFILFHCLYSLRVTLQQQETGILNISVLSIQLSPYNGISHNNSQLLDQPDPLQDYYLDPLNLDSTDEKELDNMIDEFWHKLVANEARPEALATLGLKDPVNETEIKKVWRKLVMQHHPDRGGDSHTLQSINKAFNILIK